MLLFAEHFDGYTNTTGYRTATENIEESCAYVASGGRFGGGCVENAVVGFGDVRFLKASATGNMIRLAFYMKCNNRLMSTTGNRAIIRLMNLANDRFWHFIGAGAGFTATPQISKFDDSGAPAAVAVSSEHVINDETWHHFEMALSAHPTTGSFKCKMDGVELPELTIVSGDTSDAVSGDVTTFDRIQFCGANSNTAATIGLFLDDLIVWDDSGSGLTGELTAEHRLRKIDPTANGADGVQWAPSAGSNFQCVDEAAYNSDTDYVEETVAAQIDYYNASALGWTPINIESVIVESIGRMDTGVHNWRNKLKSSAVVSDGGSKLATTTYRKTWDMYDVDPNTSAAWVQANIEAAQFGVEFVS